MTNVEFVDSMWTTCAKNLRFCCVSSAFLRANDRAEPIVEAAAMLGEVEAAYASQRIAEVLMAFGRETVLREV